MGIALPAQAGEQFLTFHALLTRANARFNLTRIPDDPREAADRNYLDSLAPLAAPGLLENVHTLLDLGSGAGFPGIPLSIVLPDVRVTLMDSLGKRVNFLNEVISELGLNAVAVHARAEEAAKTPAYREAFDAVTARAVAALPVLSELALPFVRVGGRLIAYKGPAADGELSESGAVIRRLGGGKSRVLPVRIPDRTDWDHRLVIVDKTGRTPSSFPRKPGEAGRNPILGE